MNRGSLSVVLLIGGVVLMVLGGMLEMSGILVLGAVAMVGSLPVGMESPADGSR